MKKLRIVSVLIAIAVLMNSGIAVAESTQLTPEQLNAIAMLNYITVLTQDINASKNSRLYMEEAYSSLINNTYPNAVDSRTQSQLTGLLDTMENYRMISVKRDRLQFIYEQNQAQAIRAAIPNPLALMSTIQAASPAKIAASIVYMAVDSISSYTSATAQNELQYIKDGWALDDEEATVLHNSRKGTFNYMITMVRDNKLPGDLTLTESTVEELVKWKNNDNVIARIQYLESNQQVYKSYGGYWLILAKSYYEQGEYTKCLDALATYEAIGTRIFRRDYEYARILPLAISALGEVYKDEEYVSRASAYAKAILDNTDYNDWALRYFAAQTYVEIYGRTDDKQYLQKAYNVTLDNVNYLVIEQRSLNAAYLAPVKETPTPKDATKDEKKQISNYNKMLKETRKTELPPVSEPLLLNCDLLFSLAKQLDIPANEARKIDGILHPKKEVVFLNQPLDMLYWAVPQDNNVALDTEGIEFAGTALRIPVSLISNGAVISINVQEVDAARSEIFTDWKLASVAREADSDLGEMYAIYTSNAAKKHGWEPYARIIVTITPRDGSEAKTIQLEYKAVGTKNKWYDWLKVWEGHKNEWYDYLKVWDNSVVFERVK